MGWSSTRFTTVAATISPFGASLIDDADAATAQATLGVREVLTANRTYYVDGASGSDSNDGLSSGAGAFATIGHLFNAIAAIDPGAYFVTANIAAATYSETVVATQPWIGKQRLALVGAAGATIDAANGSCMFIRNQFMSITGLKFTNSLGGANRHGLDIGFTDISLSGHEFGACTSDHISLNAPCNVLVNGDYTISGGAGSHISPRAPGARYSVYGVTVTITGTPAFSSAFAKADNVSMILSQGTNYSGSATGKRYVANALSVVSSAGAGASFFPGDVAGTVSNGGVYI